MTTRDKFVSKAVNLVNNHCVYLWGAQGEKVKDLTADDYKKVYQMETSKENAEAVIKRIELQQAINWNSNKTKAFDCSGAVCYLLALVGREPAGFDMTADSLAKRYPCRVAPVRGCLLHRSGHIGIYIGDGYLVEAKGRKYGVTVSPYFSKEWDGQFPDPFKED